MINILILSREIIEDKIMYAEERQKYKNSSYCKGQIYAYKEMLGIMDREIEGIVEEGKRV